MFLRLPTSLSAGEKVEMFYQVMSQNLVVHKSEDYRSLACRNIFLKW